MEKGRLNAALFSDGRNELHLILGHLVFHHLHLHHVDRHFVGVNVCAELDVVPLVPLNRFRVHDVPRLLIGIRHKSILVAFGFNRALDVLQGALSALIFALSEL